MVLRVRAGLAQHRQLTGGPGQDPAAKQHRRGVGGGALVPQVLLPPSGRSLDLGRNEVSSLLQRDKR